MPAGLPGSSASFDFPARVQMHVIPALVLPPEPDLIMRFLGVGDALGLVGHRTWESPAGAHLVLLNTCLVLEGLYPGP